MNVKKQSRKPLTKLARKPKRNSAARKSESLADQVKRLRRELVAVKTERDEYARELLRRSMPEFGPIEFTKRELFAMLGTMPPIGDIIDELARPPE